MAITPEHKLQLLKDLLKNQAGEQYMTIDEAAQIERLIQTLSAETAIDPAIHEALQQIQDIHTLSTEPLPSKQTEKWIDLFS